MQISYDTEKINSALKDFIRATGINVQFIRADYTSHGLVSVQNPYCAEIQRTACGKNACAASDKELLSRCRKSLKAEMKICHAGLMDVAVPIIYDGEIIGYLVLGQMKSDKSFEEAKAYLQSIGADINIMKRHYSALSVFEPEKMQSVANVAEMLAKFLLLENMMKPSFNSGIQNAVEYINKNLAAPLSVEQIAREGNISKNTLYRGFKKEFGKTVSQYITAKRIEYAEKLLLNTNLSVEEISGKAGFSSGAYFAANFKKNNGVSPLKYRKNHINNA